ASQSVDKSLRTLHVEVFKSLAEAKGKGAKALVKQDRFFVPTKPGDAPISIVGAPKVGTLGEPYLDDARVTALALSAKRKKIIKDFLPIVMPSKVGSAAFDNLQTQKSVEDTIEAMKPNNYTTCVTVPTFLSKKFVEPKHDFPMGGIIGCYWAATEAAAFTAGKPAWVVAEDKLPVLPQPGDLFIIAGKSTTPEAIKKLTPTKNNKGARTDAFECLHIGVIVDVSAECTVGG